MDNFLKLVSNRNSLKSLVKSFYMDELEKFSSNLTIIIEQRKNQEEKHRKKLSSKCRLVDLNSATHKRTRRGIALKVLRHYFDLGYSKESYLIIGNIKI